MNPIDENTIKQCNDCASKGLKYSLNNGRPQVMISEDYMREARDGMSYIQQASVLAEMIAKAEFGPAHASPPSRSPEHVSPFNNTPMSAMHSSETAPTMGGVSQLPHPISNFTLAETDARSVLPCSVLRTVVLFALLTNAQDVPTLEDLFPKRPPNVIDLDEALKDYFDLGEIKGDAQTVSTISCDEEKHRFKFRHKFRLTLTEDISYWVDEKTSGRDAIDAVKGGIVHGRPAAPDDATEAAISELEVAFRKTDFDDYYKDYVPQNSELEPVAKSAAKLRVQCPKNCDMSIRVSGHKRISGGCIKPVELDMPKPKCSAISWKEGTEESDRKTVGKGDDAVNMKKIYVTFTVWLQFEMEFKVVVICTPS